MVLGGNLDPLAPAGGAGGVLALVLVVPELGFEILLEQRHLDPDLGDQVGAQADLLAGGGGEQRSLAGGCGDAFQQHRAEHAADVVGVEAAAAADIELGLVERAQHQAALGLEQPLVGRAGKARAHAMVAGEIELLAGAHDGSQPRAPVDDDLRIGTEIGEMRLVQRAGRLADGVGQGRSGRLLQIAIEQVLPVPGVAPVDLNVVVADLKACGRLDVAETQL